METSIDRRGFLKGAAVASVAGAGLLSNVAVASEEAEGSDDVEAAIDAADGVSADVVVVGAGATGCAAAVRAAQLGLDVALIEVADTVGGTTIFAEGICAIHSHYHEEDPSLDIETGDLVKTIQDYHHWLGNGHILRQMLDQSSANLNWLESLGHQFVGLDTMVPTKPFRTWVRFAHDPGTPAGAGYVQHWGELVTQTYADRITVYFGQFASQTLLDENGAVAGVTVYDQATDEATQIACKAVVYACGGYADNAALFEELVGFGEGQYVSNGTGHRSGMGLVMARENGGALSRYPSATMWFGGILPGTMFGTELFTASSFQPLLWINENCERFIGEDMVNSVNFCGNSHSNQKRVVSLLTQAQLDSFVEIGCINGCGAVFGPGTKLDGSATGFAMWDEYQSLIDAGSPHIHTAATLDELAEVCGLDATKLKRTVEAYNGYCETGVDEEYGKPAEYLLPLREEDGPYYAFDLVPGAFTTVGGVKVNDCAQVVDKQGEPIVGMYAAGCDAGGLYGDSYDLMICEGSQQCWCAYTGKLAAEHIASTLFGIRADDDYANPVNWE